MPVTSALLPQRPNELIDVLGVNSRSRRMLLGALTAGWRTSALRSSQLSPLARRSVQTVRKWSRPKLGSAGSADIRSRREHQEGSVSFGAGFHNAPSNSSRQLRSPPSQQPCW